MKVSIRPSFWTRLLWRHKRGSVFYFVNTAAMNFVQRESSVDSRHGIGGCGFRFHPSFLKAKDRMIGIEEK